MARKKGSGGRSGIKGAIATVLMFVLIISGVVSWARINNVNSPKDAYDYFKAWSDKVAACGASELEWNCYKPNKLPPANNNGNNGEWNSSNNGNTTTKPSNKPNSKDPVNPPVNPEATNSTVPTPVINQDAPRNEMLTALEKVKEGEAVEINYKRADWKHWSGDPCDTRRQILERDGEGVVTKKTDKSCDIVSGTWTSPFDNKVFTESRDIDIDHVVPLSWAARHGGQSWTAEKKEAFANDPSHLLAVSATSNRKKGDKGPSNYMPKRDFQCQYSKIWVSTLLKYDLTATEKDIFVLQDGLEKC